MRNGKLLFNEHRVSVWQDEKVLEMERIGGGQQLNIFNVTDPYTGEWCMVYFYFFILFYFFISFHFILSLSF